MNAYTPPFDDTVQLDEMPVDFSDTSPIVDHGEDDEKNPSVHTVPGDGDISKARAISTVLILLCINLLNYMDRYTIAGVLKDIQKYFSLSNSEDGLIQTVFILTYMVFSPVFGYLGDRWIRKYIMAGGILFWSTVTLAGSFIPKDSFFGFAILRALVGIGEASYSTIAPTVIADLFVGDMRTRMLMIFYFAIPVGSGMGYIIGANVAKAFDDWRYALRITPGFGVICVILILVVVKEPKRGMSEGGTNLQATSLKADLLWLLKNKSFMLSTFGFTCVAFVTGALALWAPLFMLDSIRAQGKQGDEASVSLTFGIITVLAGFIGVALGAEISRRYKKINPRADPLVCAFGLISCTPFLFFSLVISKWYTIPTWILIFLGETCLCLNWSIVADILLYTVIPTRRSTAESVQILMSHALGDATSPYIIGLISDSLASDFNGDPKSPSIQFVTLQYSLYMTPFICVIGGGFFLATALFIEKDKDAASKTTKGILTSEDYSSTESLDQPIIISTEEAFA